MLREPGTVSQSDSRQNFEEESWGSKAIASGSLAKGTKEMLDNLLALVREKIGPIATPDYIQNAPGLPKTRSGKFRVLQGLGLKPSGGWCVVESP